MDRRHDTALFIACFREAAGSRSIAVRTSRLLDYLEVFPTGLYNRAVAEAAERCLAAMGETAERETLAQRLRRLRDPHMPPVERES